MPWRSTEALDTVPKNREHEGFFPGSVKPPRGPHLLPQEPVCRPCRKKASAFCRGQTQTLDFGAFLMDCPLLPSFGQLPEVLGGGDLGVNFASGTHTCATLPEAPGLGEGWRSPCPPCQSGLCRKPPSPRCTEQPPWGPRGRPLPAVGQMCFLGWCRELLLCGCPRMMCGLLCFDRREPN